MGRVDGLNVGTMVWVSPGRVEKASDRRQNQDEDDQGTSFHRGIVPGGLSCPPADSGTMDDVLWRGFGQRVRLKPPLLG